MIITLARFAAGVGVLALYVAGLLALCVGDRIRFRRRHGQAALDAFDAECSRIDEQLDGRIEQSVRVIPIHSGHKRLVERPPRGAA